MSSPQIIQVLIVVVIVFSLIFSYLIYKGKKQIEEKQKYTVFLAGKPAKEVSFYKLYDFLIEWNVTRGFVGKIAQSFEVLMPGDKLGIKKETVKTALAIWVSDFFLFLFLFIFSPSLIRVVTAITCTYIINYQILFFTVRNRKITLLEQTEDAIGQIKLNYQEYADIEAAIEKTAENAKYPIKLHLLKLGVVLSNEEGSIDEEISKYEETAPNRFLKVFLSLVAMLKRYGDKKVDDQSVFQTNLRYLRQEINIEITNKKKEKWMFAGYIAVCTIPIIFIESIEKWGISSFGELERFYHGAFGIMMVIVIFLATIFSYHGILRLQDKAAHKSSLHPVLDKISRIRIIKGLLNSSLDKNYGKVLRTEELLKRAGERITPKQFALKRVLTGLIAILCCSTFSNLIHVYNRQRILSSDDIEGTSSILSEKQMEEIKSVVHKYVVMWKDITLTFDEVRDRLQGEVNRSEALNYTAEMIVQKVDQYQREYYRWYEYIITILIACFVYNVPLWKVQLLKKLRKIDMDDEIIQYQSIVLMLMNYDYITIETVLLWFEKFADVFQESIQNCINNLSSGELESLEGLKKSEPYEPFVRIINSLQMCDKIPMAEAFDDIKDERYNYQENRKLENEIYLQNKSAIGNVLAWTPMFLILICYMALPWIVLALQHLFNQMGQINNYI